MVKPRVHVQGKVVVSRCGSCDPCQEWLLDPGTAPRCEALLVSWPDGEITHEGPAATALKAIRKRLRLSADPAALNVGQVEWREGTAP
jgi:hypothetical protein